MELGQLITRTNFQLFDFDYPFDDQQFKAEMEQAVIDYYFFYEIGQETPERFKQRFKQRWLRNIDYYNKLHNTTLLEYNPLINSKMSEAMEQLANSNSTQDTNTTVTSEGSTTTSNNQNATNENTTTNNLTTATNSTTNSDNNERQSDYPQQPIAGGDYASGERVSDSHSDSSGTTTNTGTVKNTGTNTGHSSGTSESEDTNTSTGKTTNTGNTNSSYSKTIEGLTGITYQDLIVKERQNLIRIQNMIIEEMKPCFILVY